MDVRAVPDSLHKKAIAFAWQQCGQIPSSSYPLFPSKQALMREYQRNGSLPGGFQIACFEQGSLRGVMFGFAEAETRYLQTTGFYVAEGDDSAAAALAAWLFASYKGYTLNVGLPAENRTVAAALCENGCRLLDDALDLRLRSADFRNATPGGFAIRRIDDKTLPRYLDFHQAHFSDCYCERPAAGRALCGLAGLRAGGRSAFHRRAVSADLRQRRGGKSTACTPKRSLPRPPFYQKPSVACSLEARGCQAVLFMADPSETHTVAAALSVGFRQENHYHCYAATL